MAIRYQNTSKFKEDVRKYRSMPIPMQKRFAEFASWCFKKESNHTLTPLQVEYCDFLQFGFGDFSEPRMALAYRGFGKTSILKLFQLWYLDQYPWEQILFIGNSDKACKSMGGTMLSMMSKIDFLSDLRLSKEDGIASKTHSQFLFNVKGKSDIEGHSWQSATYGSRDLTGLRSALIIMDDWETRAEANSLAILQQQLNMVEELWNIQADDKPHWTKIATGTYHNIEGIWTHLQTGEFNMRCRVYPVLYPDLKSDVKHYLKKVSPTIMKALNENPKLTNTPSDRLGQKALSKKPGGITSQNFRFNFMLDNSGGEESAYPLKCKDLIVYPDIDPNNLPSNLIWSNNMEDRKDYLTCVGKLSDNFYGPKKSALVTHDRPQQKIMYVDSAGQGLDEMVWIYASACKGKIFLMDIGAFRSTDKDTRYQQTMKSCKDHGIREMHIEINNNQAAVELMNSAAREVGAQVSVFGVHSYHKKEQRVLNTLTELMAQHRLVINEDVIRKDKVLSKGEISRQLFYQLSHARHMTSLGLKFDDRLDALSGAVKVLAKHVEYSAVPYEQSEQERIAQYQQKLVDSINGDIKRNSDYTDAWDIYMDNEYDHYMWK